MGVRLEEERVCPVCGLKMEMLSPQSWMCKCGYRGKGRPLGEEEKKEKGREERKLRRWEEKEKRIKKRPSTRRKKGMGSKRKRGEGY